ncbi:YgjP-like metallopeptidase domain-containing protein [Hydrogenophaga sp. RWCD_12]|uniref:YgjP-like metallopeptidase domain-containing protein n=1 Tax=Hydrogenophaga sp. RWCD_12 TaxID=3391190 RepID=UPI003984A2FC
MNPRTVNYLGGYPEPLQAQARELLAQGRLGEVLLRKYPKAHVVRSDRALFEYVQELRSRYLRGADPVHKVCYDSKLQVIEHALGTHTRRSQVQGNSLKLRREIRVATVFREAPPEFLDMIVVHELAHLKIAAHDKAFYQLCTHMLPDYHQLEFDVRLYLTHRDAVGPLAWG